MSYSQHKLFRGRIIPVFCVKMGIDPTKENKEEVAKIFKDHLGVKSTAGLSTAEYSSFISTVIMLMSREYGIDILHELDKKSMKELLKEIT